MEYFSLRAGVRPENTQRERDMSSAGIISALILAAMKMLFKMDSVTGVASVELWVVMTTLLLVVRFLLDCCGPSYADMTMATSIQVIDMLNYSMVHYTMGMMRHSANKVNDYFQAWAVLLVTLQYSVKTGRLYQRSKQIPLFDLMSSLWSANLIQIQTFFLLRFPLWLIWVLNAARIISYFASSDRAATINQENTRLVSDYMRYEHTLGPSGDAAAGSDGEIRRMQWYKYLVSGEDRVLRDAQQERRTPSAQYRIRLDPHNKKLVTIDKIWNADAGSSWLLGSTTDTRNRLKDVCLSFALYKLVRSRFYNLPIHKASQEKMKLLVFDYILQDTDNYERAFRVTFVELSFLQDLFYSKHAAMFASGFPVFNMVMSLFLIAATGYLAYPVRYIPERMDQADKNIITHGVSVTRIIIGLIIAKELLEVYLYVFSQWNKVLMICMYVKHRCLRNAIVEAAMRSMFWFIRGKWNQKIFQYNLLISRSHCLRKFPRRIKLDSEVKTAIFKAFKDLQQHPERLESYFKNAFGPKESLMKQLEKGPEESLMKELESGPKESLMKQLEKGPEEPVTKELESGPKESLTKELKSGPKESLMKELEWAIKLEADTHRILVWHIATCFCEIHSSAEVKNLKVLLLQNKLLARKSTTPDDVWPHYITAVSLSNYCAYLLTKALVPDNGIVVTKVLNAVRRETRRGTNCSFFQSMQDVYNKLTEIAKKPVEVATNGEGDEVHEGHKAPESSPVGEEVLKMDTDAEDPHGEEQNTGEDDI